MSMTKNLLFKQYEREQKERAECKECRLDWQSKIISLCDKHQREVDEMEAEQEWWESLDAHYALTMN